MSRSKDKFSFRYWNSLPALSLEQKRKLAFDGIEPSPNSESTPISIFPVQRPELRCCYLHLRAAYASPHIASSESSQYATVANSSSNTRPISVPTPKKLFRSTRLQSGEARSHHVESSTHPCACSLSGVLERAISVHSSVRLLLLCSALESVSGPSCSWERLELRQEELRVYVFKDVFVCCRIERSSGLVLLSSAGRQLAAGVHLLARILPLLFAARSSAILRHIMRLASHIGLDCLLSPACQSRPVLFRRPLILYVCRARVG